MPFHSLILEESLMCFMIMNSLTELLIPKNALHINEGQKGIVI